MLLPLCCYYPRHHPDSVIKQHTLFKLSPVKPITIGRLNNYRGETDDAQGKQRNKRHNGELLQTAAEFLKHTESNRLDQCVNSRTTRVTKTTR